MHLYNLANAYFALEDYRRSVELYRRAIRITPGRPDFHYNLGNAYSMLDNKQNAFTKSWWRYKQKTTWEHVFSLESAPYILIEFL
jgi:tetratricopeptide (TPR) repeat protein